MTHPNVFISIDNTHRALAMMANLSIDGLKSLANCYRSSIHQIVTKQMTARTVCLSTLAISFFAFYQAVTTNKRSEEAGWAVIGLGSSIICITSLFMIIYYAAKISDQTFYLNAAQAMLLSRV